ncbi:hypothetical protein ACN23B_05055 [Anabaena sp. FACHB-709]|uniref:Uncharacterized protein n=2 Tax=Nostocaceae TaxID=1162 RepID=A0A1Z4KSS7_ANAVA|nr:MULTISPECIES: hypothetical protein [Nostocaceae]BAY71984.1 hypothetical protein NIES23_48080 [Trichormus variabilis NIES-23]HBW28682.1 hypothetical protein [Nostoc sp. UBA8866]MBD2171573.1 hypothetical protein [Anabaena cylindrica FACHB-318]MBD2263358.1 hypothetical protein [Anabaena sp. FACHB-709]MBD2272903.1 hypothetical protein [Nostoc sp. PCC 7120 = FACHB-418]
MANLFSKVITHIKFLFPEFQVKRFFAIALVGFLVLTTSLNSTIDSGRSSDAVTRRLDRVVHQDDADRPKTTGEWNREARQTEDNPGERAKRIAKESGEAVKQFGSVYPDTAKRSANDLQDNNR